MQCALDERRRGQSQNHEFTWAAVGVGLILGAKRRPACFMGFGYVLLAECGMWVKGRSGRALFHGWRKISAFCSNFLIIAS